MLSSVPVSLELAGVSISVRTPFTAGKRTRRSQERKA